jgi:hypothetical protein
MDLDLFTKPTGHPWGMLDHLGLKHTWESENLLAAILFHCLEQGEWCPKRLQPGEILPPLERSGLLIDEGNNFWSLTDKAKDLLLKYYAAGETTP